MTFKQALLHNTGWKIFTLLFTFINNIIIVRLLGIVDSGQFFFTLAAFTLVSTFLRLGLENGVIYFGSKNKLLIRQLSYFLLIVLVVQFMITFICIKVFFENNQYTLIWCTLFVVGNIATYYVNALYQIKEMYVSLNVIATTMACIQTLLFSLLFYSNSISNYVNIVCANSKNAILCILTFALLLQLIIQSCYFYHKQNVAFKNSTADSTLYPQLFTYSLINFVGGVILFLIIRVDFYFVEKYCTGIELGNYVQVAKIGQMVLFIPSFMGGVIFPYGVNADKTFEYKITFFCRVITLIFLLIYMAILAMGNGVFTWLLGVKFSLMAVGLLATLPGVYCLALSTILISYFEGKNKQLIVIISSAITLVTLILADILVVPKYGYIGAAVVFSFANSIGVSILIGYFIMYSQRKIKDIFLFTKNDLAIFTSFKNKKPIK